MAAAQNSAGTRHPDATQTLLRLIVGYRLSQAIAVAARLGIADLVKDGPQCSAALAEATGAHPAALSRVLRLLASEGIFAEVEQGQFASTPLAVWLQADVTGSLRSRAMMDGSDWNWRSWGELMHSVQTGEPAFERLFGMGHFEYLEQHAGDAALFQETMAAQTTQTAQAVVAAYDFSVFRTVVDVGGGHGALIAAVLRAQPHLQGILFDMAPVAAGARTYLEAAGVADRCDVVAGDFFHAVPDGASAYMLKFVIHDWDDARALAILRNCRRAVREPGRLLLVETVIPPGNEPFYGKFLDLNMLVLTGGRERTEAEYRALLARAGFQLTRLVPAHPLLSVIEALPVRP